MEMRLEDLQTQETHPIDGGGVTLGRDSRRSSIVIADPGVSGAHARIFERAGRYFIEDSNSSNGTFVEGTRLRGELELKDGFVIALHKYKFKVVLDGGSVGDSTALFEPKGGKGDGGKKAMASAATRTQARSTEPEDAAIEDEQIDEPDAGGGRRPTDNGRRDSQQQILRDPGVDDGVDDEEDPLFEDEGRGSPRELNRPSGKKSSKADANADAMKAGFGQALTYYLGAVPKMALMPKAAVAKMVEDQPFKPMDKMELALWAAPPLALGSIVALIAALVVGLVTGTFGASTIINPIIYGAITIVGGSAIAGWVWHPFMTWWVKLLKGESDPQSRTNMMVATFTGLSIIYIATGIGALFTLLVRIPVVGAFMQIGPLLLVCAASLLSLYIAMSWYKYFRVTHWVPKVIVVLGVLTIANAAWGSINLIRAGASSAGAGIAASGDVPQGLTAEQRKQLAAAQAAAQAAGMNAQANAATAQAQATVAAAQAQAVAAQGAAQTQAAATQPAAPTHAAATQPTTTTTPTPSRDAPSRVEMTDDDDAAQASPSKATAKADRPTAAKADAVAHDDAGDQAAPRPVATDKPTMAEYNQHMAAIEKMIDEDPSLLSRVNGAMALYKKIHANDAKLKSKTKLDPVSERIRQAELYGANVDAVEELYSKISAP